MSDEDYKLLQDKYGKLIYYTALRISGDKSQSPEDYVNAIWAHILHYLPKYMVQENVPTVEEFISKYNAWVKQWIFTVKNQLGSEITKDKILQASSINDNESNDFDVEDKSHSDLEHLELVTLYDRLPNNQLGSVARALITYDDVYTSSGKLNFTALKRRTNIPVPMLRRIIEELKDNISDYIDS
jgi:hypothetical protein